MLQYKLSTEPAENIRGAYVQKDGAWFLDSVSHDYPLIAHNETLTAELRTAEAKARAADANAVNFENQLNEAKAKGVPSGYRAVKKEIAELGELASSEGFTGDSIKETKSKIESFEAKLGDITFAQDVSAAAQSINRNGEGVKTLLKANGFALEAVEETVDGVKVKKYFAVKGADKEKESVALADYVAANGAYIPPHTAEAAPPQGIPFFAQTPGAGQPGMSTKELIAARLQRKYQSPPTAPLPGAAV